MATKAKTKKSAVPVKVPEPTYNFEIPAKVFEAARLCMGTKDVRYYLNGVCITSKAVTATDGHTMYHYEPATSIGGVPFELIIRPQSAVPVAATTASFEVTGSRAIITYRNAKGVLKYDFGQVVDGKFPDVYKVLPDAKKPQSPAERIGFNPDYLIKGAKAIKAVAGWKEPLTMVLQGPTGAAYFTYTDKAAKAKHLYLVMPMRIDG